MSQNTMPEPQMIVTRGVDTHRDHHPGAPVTEAPGSHRGVTGRNPDIRATKTRSSLPTFAPGGGPCRVRRSREGGLKTRHLLADG